MLIALFWTRTASAVPSYNITPIGLGGSEHTRNNGYMFSQAVQINTAGQVQGYSNRYNGTGTDMGRSIWLYDGATTLNIGLTDTEHTRNDGYRFNTFFDDSPPENFKEHTLEYMNSAGQVTGTAARFNGGSGDLGRSAWLYNGTTTLDIGLTGPEYTRSDGYKLSQLSWGYYQRRFVNSAGHVMGISERYNGSSDIGNSAWLYNGTTTVPIGLTDGSHTASDGSRFSMVNVLSDSGQVAGTSNRYSGSTLLGSSAWYYNGTSTVDIGFTGAGYTRTDGYQTSGIGAFGDDYGSMNASGKVIGYSYRYGTGSSASGVTAWLYDGQTTKEIGLHGSSLTDDVPYAINKAGQVLGIAEFDTSTVPSGKVWIYDGTTTKDIGINSFYELDVSNIGARPMNEAGQVIGWSSLGATGSQRVARFYNGTSTIQIGLYGPDYTANDGRTYIFPSKLNESGKVVGYSYRYKGAQNYSGLDAWLYNGSTTVLIGLNGSENTASDGSRYSRIQEFNNAGQAIGTSGRYSGSTGLGTDGWLYDPNLNQTIQLPPISTRSDGSATTVPTYLGEDGLVLGWYDLYDAASNDLGLRAFYFTIADGMHDLGSLVSGGLPANGWDSLANTLRSNGFGNILGYGKLTSQSGGQFAYLLTPASVPEPSTLLLAALAFVPVAGRIRRAEKGTDPHVRDVRFTSPAVAIGALLASLLGLASTASAQTVRLEESQISLVGAWQIETGYSEYSGGKAAIVNYSTYDPTAYATFNFSGTSITWIGAKTYNGGLFDWIIDAGTANQRNGTINTYSAIVHRSTTELLSNNLSPGSHTFRFTTEGINGNTGAHSVPSETYIDAFDITSAVPEPSTFLLAALSLVAFAGRIRRRRDRDCSPNANLRFAPLLVVILAIASVTPASAQQAFFTGIGFLPGSNSAYISQVSADGSTFVGNASSAAGTVPIRWTRAGGIEALGTLPGHIIGVATNVSADGSSIVGLFGFGSDTQKEVFRWTAQTGLVSILQLSNNRLGNVYVTSDGLVVFGHYDTSNYSPFRWTPQTGLVFLPKLVNGTTYQNIRVDRVSDDGAVMFGEVDGGYSATYPFGTVRWTQADGFQGLADGLPAGSNSDGTSIGITGYDIEGSGVPPLSEDVLWSASQGIVHLGPLVNAPPGSTPTKVYVGTPSQDGKIVSGFVYLQPSDVAAYNSRATRWTQAKGWTLLPSLPGGALPKTISGRSGDGSTFVGEATGGTDSGLFIWDAIHGSRNLLQVLMNDYGLGSSTAGWNITSANITPDGHTLYGNGVDPNGKSESWIAFLGTAVPEPSTSLLLVLGISPFVFSRSSRRLQRNARLPVAYHRAILEHRSEDLHLETLLAKSRSTPL